MNVNIKLLVRTTISHAIIIELKVIWPQNINIAGITNIRRSALSLLHLKVLKQYLYNAQLQLICYTIKLFIHDIKYLMTNCPGIINGYITGVR
jgi:hypothetical protein